MRREDEPCPRCGEPTECETVHNGVGLLYGPAYCSSCGWSEYENAGKTIDGYYHDIAGGATPIGYAPMSVVPETGDLPW